MQVGYLLFPERYSIPRTRDTVPATSGFDTRSSDKQNMNHAYGNSIFSLQLNLIIPGEKGYLGRKVGKVMISLRESSSPKSITRRSMPIPKPPVGGIPYSRASTKSSSMG